MSSTQTCHVAHRMQQRDTLAARTSTLINEVLLTIARQRCQLSAPQERGIRAECRRPPRVTGQGACYPRARCGFDGARGAARESRQGARKTTWWSPKRTTTMETAAAELRKSAPGATGVNPSLVRRSEAPQSRARIFSHISSIVFTSPY